jgi:hypothetical protein
MSLAACGGSGGDAAVPTTKVVLSAYLFGTMSSSTAKVTSVHASMKVPSGVFVNYSSPAPSGYPANTYPLKSSAIAASGALPSASASTSGTYNTATGMIELSILNSPASNNTVPDLRSTSSGNGTEFAKLFFRLATTDINTPFLPASQALTYEILQTDLANQTSGTRARGCDLKFSTSYQ